MTPDRDPNRAARLFVGGCLAATALILLGIWGTVAGFRKPFRWLSAVEAENRQTTEATSSLKAQEPGGPILVISSGTNPFSTYYAEILRAEGLNEFKVTDISQVTARVLGEYAVAIVGEVPLKPAQAAMLKQWITAGGHLIAMRPDKQLAAALGLPSPTTTLRDGYLSFNTALKPGRGLVKEPIQFHGPADVYLLDASSHEDISEIATLYADAKKSADAPAVLTKQLGAGTATVFAFDLARSVVYTRQGNPAWSGMERDGLPPMRPDDLFYGAASYDREPDWVDHDKVAIPQADEQQRLLTNLILEASSGKKPLPRFWYFPRALRAVVIMTGDDHGQGGTVGRFDRYQAETPANCSLDKWQCIRSTSYIFLGSIDPEAARAAAKRGFEIGLHVYHLCEDWPRETKSQPQGGVQSSVSWSYADSLYTDQLERFHELYPDISQPVTNRIDCLVWGDYDTQPRIEEKHGMRLDTSYYYWPDKWVNNSPGMFTGSGIPMRFAKADGSLINVYQTATQMTDESGQSYPFTIDKLLDNALGPNEFIGAFTANMHNDQTTSKDAEAIIASAHARGVPIITAAQMLQWLDGRNASSFHDLSWQAAELSFSIDAAPGAEGLSALLPIKANDGELAAITLDGAPITYQKMEFAGITYAIFPGVAGKYIARYGG